MSSTTNSNYTASSLITMLPCEPSVCIPRVFMNIQKERVYDVFADLFGRNAIERVDMIERKNKDGEEYKRAFVHFKFWPRTEQATEVRLKLLNGDEVKVMYEQPWFWRISASRVPRPEEQQPRRKETVPSRPFILIDDEQTRPRPQHREQREQQQPPRRERRDYRDERPYQSRDYHHHDAPRGYERRDDDRRAPREHNEHRREHNEYRREHHAYDNQRRANYQRRMDDRRPPNVSNPDFRSPAKTEPEIASWVKTAPGAPGPKKFSKKSTLVLDGGDETTAARPRRLSFDETEGGDIEEAKTMATEDTPKTTTTQDEDA